MGAYLSEPITKKISSDENGTSVAFGASSMQGWRVSQEDAHNCCINFDNNTSLFAVYDGHGGHEVATYCAKELPDFIKNTEAYKAGNIKQALIDAFLGFDNTLTKPAIIALLKEIAGSNENEKEKTGFCDSDDEESVSDLRKEAAMPLDQVIARYHRSDMSDFHMKDVQEDTYDKGPCVSSPYLRCRRSRDKSNVSSGAEAFSTEAGCSSSSSSWKSDQPEVTGSSATSADTTNSNGSIDRTKSQTEAEKPEKSTDDIPDSSADVKTQEIKNPSAEISKICQDNVSSSSSSAEPVENGQIQQEPTTTRRRITPTQIETHLYQSLLRKASSALNNRRQKNNLPGIDKSQQVDDDDDDDEDDDEQDDDDEENDETFDLLRGSSDDDIQDLEDGNENNSSSDNEEHDNAKEANDEEDEDDDEAEEDDDDDDYEDEDDDDGGDFSMNMTEEPGSDSGCTAVVAILHSRDLYVANAGDSRCVLCRDGQALELSLDHKPEDEPEMKRIIKAGGKVTGDGRVNGGLNLSRALGDHAYKQNTTLPAQEQMISALPDIRHITVEPGRDEFMILACDGIWNFMSSQEVVSFIRPRLANLKESNISSICEELFDHCLAPDTQGDGTGCDNMTAVIVKFNWSDDASKNSNNGSECVPNIISGQATISKKRPISPSNVTEISTENQESSASEKNAEKHNLTDCTSSTSNNDSTIKDSCKRSKTEIV